MLKSSNFKFKICNKEINFCYHNYKCLCMWYSHYHRQFDNSQRGLAHCAKRCTDEWITINIILFSGASTVWIHKDSSLCRSFDHREHGLTWWPIKSNIQQPLLSFTVTFDINHSHQGSAVRFQAAGLLWSLPRTPRQNRPLYITASLGGLLLDTRAPLPERKKNIFKL